MIRFEKQVRRWGVFEAVLSQEAPLSDNPFADVSLWASFTSPNGEIVRVRGFYAGEGVWKLRFMPDAMGGHHFRIQSNCPAFDGETGAFECVPNEAGEKGPVRVRGRHFFYADQTPAFICGTTLYAWWYRPTDVCEQTLSEIERYGFNKVRMLVFPKYLAGFVDFELTHQPPCLPFEKQGDRFDFSRPVPAYFDLLDERIEQLKALGVQADVILFHNYDFGMWGIDDQLTDDAAERYLDYLIARIGAHSNVWWSLANEYDLQKKQDGSGCYSRMDRRDWDRLGRYVYENDPYRRPISVHNLGPVYPNADWLSHVSVQFPNTYSLLLELQQRYDKPVINDEYQYEGNLIDNWGNLSAEEETIRHYLSLMAGCYATHGECYIVDDNRRDIFWTYGGKMHGQSAARIRFLKQLAERMPFSNMTPDHTLGDGRSKFCLRYADKQIFVLYTPDCPERDRAIGLGVTDGKPRKYRVTVYDLWNMRVLRSFRYDFGKMENPKRDEFGNPIENPLMLREQGLLGVYFEQLI